MWEEPLIATSYDADKNLRQVEVHADKLLVLSVQYKYWPETSCSALGEVILHDKAGSARQRVRAFSLAIRECAQSASDLGIERYAAMNVPEHMQDISEAVADKMSRAGHVEGRPIVQREGFIADLLASVTTKTETDGRIKQITPEKEQELIDKVDQKDTRAENVRADR